MKLINGMPKKIQKGDFKESIRFTKHALQRARERKLWKYVSKERFYFDAVHSGDMQARIDNCIYVYGYKEGKTVIITMARK